MNPQYEILAKCLLPTHMLEWFDLTNVEVKPKEKTATRDTHSEEASVNVVHLYLDENALRPDNRVDCAPTVLLRPRPSMTFPYAARRCCCMCAAVAGLTRKAVM